MEKEKKGERTFNLKLTSFIFVVFLSLFPIHGGEGGKK